MALKPLTEAERKEAVRVADHNAEGVPANDPVAARMKDSAEAQLDVVPDCTPLEYPHLRSPADPNLVMDAQRQNDEEVRRQEALRIGNQQRDAERVAEAQRAKERGE